MESKKVLVGKDVFFKDVEEHQKENKYIAIVFDEEYTPEADIVKVIYKNEKEEYLKDVLIHKKDIDIDILLTPEVIELLEISPKEFISIKNKLRNENKYKYYRLIARAYVENKEYKLTKEQQQNIHNIYKQYN